MTTDACVYMEGNPVWLLHHVANELHCPHVKRCQNLTSQPSVELLTVNPKQVSHSLSQAGMHSIAWQPLNCQNYRRQWCQVLWFEWMVNTKNMACAGKCVVKLIMVLLFLCDLKGWRNLDFVEVVVCVLLCFLRNGMTLTTTYAEANIIINQ